MDKRLKQRLASVFATFMFLAVAAGSAAQHAYAGFDRNNYPGDAALPALRKSFHYTSYWLSNPPGEKQMRSSRVTTHLL